jgi:hypothetical protein
MSADDQYYSYDSAHDQKMINRRLESRYTPHDSLHYPRLSLEGLPRATSKWDKTTFEPNESSFDYGRQKSENSVEHIKKRIMGQNADAAAALGDQWDHVVTFIDNIAASIRNETDALRNGTGHTGGPGAKGWHSPAADAFLARGPGATLKSLDDWRDMAVRNRDVMHAMAGVIRQRQVDFADFYDRYRRTMVAKMNEFTDGGPLTNIPADRRPQFMDIIKDLEWEWTCQAQAKEYDMAQDYYAMINTGLDSGGRGTVYEGPHDAVVADPKLVMPPPPGMPHAPHVPHVPGAVPTPPAVPALPVELNLTGLTPPTVPGEGVPLPVLPEVPAVIPGLSEMPIMGTPVLARAVLPALDADLARPGLRATPVNAPEGLLRGLTNARGVADGVLRASSTGLPAAGAQPPAGLPPQLPGGARRPGRPQETAPHQDRTGQRAGNVPAQPGAARRRADQTANPFAPPGLAGLPDRTVDGQSAPAAPVLRAPRPGARAPRDAGTLPPGSAAPGATPPVLGRRRGSAPAEGTALPAQPRPEVPGFTTPPATAAVLRGQAGPAGGPVIGEPAAPATPASTLRGRASTGAPDDTAMASRHKHQAELEAARIDREFEQLQQFLADEAAWTVQTPGGAVLDNTPVRHRSPQTELRPALGAV